MEQALKELASHIWDKGVTPLGTELLIVKKDFSEDDLEIESIIGEECISYSLDWKERGKSVWVTLYKNEAYGAAARVRTIGTYLVEI